MEGVFLEIRSSLMRIVSRYLRHQQGSVEDVVQEAYVKALEAQQNTHIRNPRAYLYRTTRNLALKELEKSMNRLTDYVEGEVLESCLPAEAGLDQTYEARQKFELFCRAVRCLPVKCRRVYILRKVYGFSQKEIARHLGISEKTVEAHIAKAAVRCTEFIEASENSLVQPSVRSSRAL